MSILGLPSNHYRMPAHARAIAAVNGSAFAENDSHIFICGTCVPYAANEMHILNYTEGTADVTCIGTCAFRDEFRCLCSIDSERNQSEVEMRIAVASRDTKTPKYESCTLYRLKFDENNRKGDLSSIASFGAPAGFQNIQKVILDPNYENSAEQKRIAVIENGGFHLYRLINNSEIAYKKLASGSLLDRICHSGAFDPHHSNLFITGDSDALFGWDIRVSRPAYIRQHPHSMPLTDIDYNPNVPNIFATSSRDGSLRFWDIRKLDFPFQDLKNLHSHWINAVRYNQFHDELLLTAGTDNAVKLHRVETDLEKISSGHRGQLDGNRGNSSNDNYNKEKKAEIILTYDEHEDSVYSICWSANDAWCFASISNDGRFAVDQVPSQEKYRILL